MTQMWRWWFVGAGALLPAACTELAGPRAVQLGFTVGPTDATAGVTIGPVVAVAIEDASGNTVTGATNVVSVSIGTNPTGGTLAGTVSVAPVNGVATFSNLHVDKAGMNYTLKASATGLAEASSTAFTITAGPATRLAFTVQPGNTMGGAPATPPVQVAAQDSFGNIQTGFGDSVTVALGGNPAAGTLSGATVVPAVNGVATFSDLSIAQVSAGYTLTATARGIAGVTSVPFNITPPTGRLSITAVTSGSSPDPDGYAACIDPVSDGHGGTAGCGYGGSPAVGANGTVTMTVDTGAHAVLLMGVAVNCTVAGDNPRAVHASQAETVAVPFAIACVAVTLHVTTTTTGISFDPDGYDLCVDPAVVAWDYGCATYEAAIGVNSGVTVPVAAGTHVVELSGVASNCTVSGENPRTVTANAKTEVPFVVTCAAAGSMRVTAATSGTDVSLNGYLVCVDGSGNPCFRSAVVPVNGVVTLSVIAGPHTVTLRGLAENCTVSGAPDRAVTVPADATVDVAFEVGCVLAERIAFSSGGRIAVIHADGSATQSITPGLAPAWSPDGARLAYECYLDICAIDANGTGFVRLTVNGTGNHHPTWSPDRLKIAFAATPGGVPDLYVMAANGSGVGRLTQGIGFKGSPAWSPNGSKIAFDCQLVAGNDDICVVNADGTGLARLTSDPARDYGAAWKPDGSTLAFVTTRYGADEIVLMSSAGGSVTRIGTGLPGLEPTWSPDGTRLAFVQVYTCDDWCSTDNAIFVATSDGAVVSYLTAGDQPAWKPHP